jgi:hypothetical protein
MELFLFVFFTTSFSFFTPRCASVDMQTSQYPVINDLCAYFRFRSLEVDVLLQCLVVGRSKKEPSANGLRICGCMLRDWPDLMI